MARNAPTTEELAQAGAPDEHLDSETSKVLKEKRAALAKLRAEKEMQLLDEEMERLKSGGKGPKLVALLKDLEKVRTETAKEGEFALYQVPTRSYLDPTGMGKTPILNAEGAVVRRRVSELPDIGWKPVKISEAPLEKKYVAA